MEPVSSTSRRGADIIICIYAKDFHRFHPYGNHIASWYNVDLSFTHALLQNHLLRSQPFGSHEK